MPARSWTTGAAAISTARSATPTAKRAPSKGSGDPWPRRGTSPAALESYAGVLAEGRARRNPQMQGTALQSIGEIHLRLGNLDIARPLFEQSRTHFEAA